jgi:hypothetical protein
MAAKKTVAGKPATKREHAPEKRRRVAANRKAKQDAVKYVVPVLIILFVALAAFFFYRFGFGKKLAARINKSTGRK